MVIIALENIAIQLDKIKRIKWMFIIKNYYPALSQELDNFNYILNL